MNVTREQLLQIMPLAKARVDTFLPFINRFAPEFGITSNKRMAHYLAQIAHESAELRYTREIADGSAYEGRKDLGNSLAGDGKRFRGRGLIQITGRANYTKYKKYCGFDVVRKPELLEAPLGAVRSSMWFWVYGTKDNLNTLADNDMFTIITRRINGGTNGIDSRMKYLERAKKALGVK